MSTQDSLSDVKFEIGHVLFIDIVGYSKLLINEQSDQLQTLKQIVRNTEQFRTAEAQGKLLRLPTGDGGALVFRTSPEAPVLCALEINKALKSHPELKVRMGIHSGPVTQITDLNEQANIAGAGINLAQRVMDCGDAGHILLSKHVADDLEEYPRWRPMLHQLGECRVKHGVNVSVVNLYNGDAGNSAVPERFRAAQPAALSAPAAKRPKPFVPIAIVLAALIVGALVWQLLRQVGTPPQGVRSESIQDHGRLLADAGSLPIPEKSIAVLPFENFSESKENAFFADGVQDDILTALAKISDLKVISRTSVMSYAANAKRNLREIGRALGVAHVLEGSVRRAGNQVRITAQLVDTRTDSHIWADTYDRNLADVFAIQSDIAKTIADQLRAKLSPTEKAAIEEQPTRDITAHDLYVRGKLLNESSGFDARRLEKLVEAAGLLDQAVAHDPDFFLAYCLLVNTHGLIYFYGLDHTPARKALAESAVNAASHLRPDAAETHLARAEFFYRFYLDYDRARSELALAQRALPNNPQLLMLLGYIDRRQDLWKESIQHMQRALEFDPRNWFYLQQISLGYQFLRDFADMAAALDRVNAILPNDVVTRIARAWVEIEWHADTRPLHEATQALLKEDPGALVSVTNYLIILALSERDPAEAERIIAVMPAQGVGYDGFTFPIPFWKAVLARTQGDAATAQNSFLAARAIIEPIVREQPDFAIAICMLGLIDAGLGRKEQAIAEGHRAVELLPKSKDAINGTHMIQFMAVIYAWTGEKDLAIEQLKAAVQAPGLTSYGNLKLHPWWDPLRGDARFEKIVASLAPKDMP